MSTPVWVLSVDLQTKTATFESGLAGAAKSARSSFAEIEGGAASMGDHVSTNMFASRHAIMAVSEAFGDTMPRAITALIVHIGPLGAALEAAFPYAAIGLAAVLIIEHMAKMREESEKLTSDQMKFGTAIQTTFNGLDEKLLEAMLRSDELRNDHLGALAVQLQLIDKQSMSELVHALAEVAKESDAVFAGLQSHWYTFGIGSAGAKHALTQFQDQYESLLRKGNAGAASDLLKGTRDSAEKILELQKKAANSDQGMSGVIHGEDPAKVIALQNAALELQKSGVGYTEKEVKAQEALVQALNSQISSEEQVAKLKKQTGDNDTLSAAQAGAAQQSAAMRAAAESRLRIGETILAAERAKSAAMMDVTRASVAERMAAEIGFADKELTLRLKANAEQTAALDGYAKDYPNQLKAMHEKAEELEAQHTAAVSEIRSKGSVTQNAKDLANIESGVRESIDATERGSAARLAAIDAGLKREGALNMQDLSAYRDLLTQRVQTVREAAEQESKLRAEAGKEAADNDEKMGSLALAAQRQHQALLDSAHRVSIAQRMAEDIAAANAEQALRMTAMQAEAAALDKSGKDYENKLKTILDKEKQLVQQHENDVTAIKNRAETERNSRILAADRAFTDTIASNLTQTLMGHKSFAASMDSIGNQVVSGLMETAIKSVLANDFTKESDAAAAARKAFLAGMQFPFPANVILGPLMGAAAFASVMAFEDGGVVPGVGRGDTVPAMVSPGEGIIPGSMMGKLNDLANSGGMSGGNHYHAHVKPVYNLQAIDSNGVQHMLEKHSATLTKHVENTLRKLNR